MPPALLKSSSALPAQPARAGGFALLITITLLSFVVLLLVGLATYTRIETAISGNTQKQAQARQNALLALDVALGQLQKYAGPDQRVTATAASFDGGTGTNRYTGVWDATTLGTTPTTWLVSGNETNALAIKPTTSLNATNAAELVGLKTSALANDVRAPLVPITTVGVPGQATTATIGRYAWWVGDQGVKAPVAVPDKSGSVTYSPWTDSELIRQQISLGAPASDTTAATVFDAQSSTNATLVSRLPTTNQLTFLNKSTTGTLGLAGLQARFHDWSSNNFNVLANTASNSAGLRQDLSLDPSLLGTAAQAWLDYTTYMEAPVDAATSAFPPMPDITASSLRRRYVMQPGPPAISPVLSFFLLSFNVRTLPTDKNNPSATPQPVQVRARGAFSLWNPYSSALVPEELQLEITGLPATLRLDNQTTPDDSQWIPFSSLFSSLFENSEAIRIRLPWSTDTASGSPAADQRFSWLPGRTYSWTIKEDLTESTPSANGFDSELNSQNIDSVSGAGIQRTIPDLIIDGSDQCHLELSSTSQLKINLIAVRPSGNVSIASFTSPEFEAFTTTTRNLGSFTYSPSFVFRLAENENGPSAWLASSDLREPSLPASAYVFGTDGSVLGGNPALYENTKQISAPERLLDRDVASITYNEDVPVFELPRLPLLSLGMLQHLAVDVARPFSIGNSWGAATTINSIPSGQLFDQFFFSGLVSGVNPTGLGTTLVLPNPLLRVSPRISTGAATTVNDLRSPIDARSSKYLLQGGAFNLNSTSVPAWTSVLRTVRFTTPATAFKYLKLEENTGTASIDASNGGEIPLSVQSTDAHFFRFSQSAQETYKAEVGQSAGGSTGVTPPKTELFRQGMVTLSSAQVQNLATKITAAIRVHQSSSGPFRTLEEFLSPSANATTSLLEQAIADAGINVDSDGNPIEFSSQFLTQGDIMTALAPVLFPRSDTFVIRTYGEAVNTATGATEGKAWCEATVQRIPDYFDPSDDANVAPADITSTLNQNLGRRFKVVSFRWLTRSDI